MPYVNTVPDTRGPKGLQFREMLEQDFQSSTREPWEGAGLRQAPGQPGMKAGGEHCGAAASCASAGWRARAFERAKHGSVLSNHSPW